MGEKDLYEDLIRYYEFQLGRLPGRVEFKEALKATFNRDDLRIFFLLPFLGQITREDYAKKALKAGIPPDELQRRVKKLQPEGIIDTYEDAQKGRVYSRAWIISLLEFQVRLKQDSPMRAACTTVMNAFIEGATDAMPTRTPYYRVLPVEAALTGAKSGQEILVNAVVPDPREVLPIDIVSEMIKKEPIIAVSDCYCRSTKKLVGEDCGHPLETCFYFNELALIKLEAGYSRRVEYDEALSILRSAEKAGLVHNVSNCEGKILTLCNCCACSCGVLRAKIRGQTNVDAPSRFHSVLAREKCTLCGDCVKVCPMDVFAIHDEMIEYKAGRCIGCGLCVSVCKDGALSMALRKKRSKIFVNNDALQRQINLEGMVGLVVKKVTGK